MQENLPEPEPRHRNRSGLPDAWSSPRLQPTSRRGDRTLTQGVIGDRLDRLAYECLDQKPFGFFFGKTARTQIKQQGFVQRASGRAVTTGDVVGEDLQLRLIVGLGFTCGHGATTG